MNPARFTFLVFQRTLIAWVLGFSFCSWAGFDGSNVLNISPTWLPPGPLRFVTHGIAMLPDAGRVIVTLVAPWLIVLLSAVELWRPGSWWRTSIIWWLYLNLMNVAWLASSGGQQLMANMLFWSIFLAIRSERAQFLGFWAIRLQLLLAYSATALHKLTGTHWLDGTALGIAATDQAFGPAWLASLPTLAMIMTWLVLLFQLSFPIAIWFRALRLPWMLFGIAFHLGTGFWMDIPEMGLAFIVCYTIWLDDAQAERLLRFLRLPARRSTAG